jgi:galactitol-specific phosphotransferase system IIB component
MESIETKLEQAKNWLEENIRGYNYNAVLCTNIKVYSYIDIEDIKEKLCKKYHKDIIEEINFEKEYEFFEEMSIDLLFEDAREALGTKEVYQYGRSGGWLGSVELCKEIREALDEIESDLYDGEFSYFESKREMHKAQVFKDIERIKKAFEDIKKQVQYYSNNLTELFIEYIEYNVMDSVIDDIKAKNVKYNTLITYF